MIDKSYIDRLKEIPIPDYLAAQGFVPAKRIGSQLVYLSPLTGEKTPSFFVHPEKNVFHCFSSGHKGDIITLVRQLEQVEFQQALFRIGNFSLSEYGFDYTRLDRNRFQGENQLKPAAKQPTEYEHKTQDIAQHAIESASQLELLAVKTLSNRVLINYLHSRGYIRSFGDIIP